MKRRIKLNESDIRRIVKESIKSVLRESSDKVADVETFKKDLMNIAQKRNLSFVGSQDYGKMVMFEFVENNPAIDPNKRHNWHGEHNIMFNAEGVASDILYDLTDLGYHTNAWEDGCKFYQVYGEGDGEGHIKINFLKEPRPYNGY